MFYGIVAFPFGEIFPVFVVVDIFQSAQFLIQGNFRFLVYACPYFQAVAGGQYDTAVDSRQFLYLFDGLTGIFLGICQ